ncbi:MAG: hypothetical protein LBP83_05145 [Dysgonamonadaceae bacterium]|jgi:hypothetical protein|nr:hypothetical protein [Dysgonamonadaceae bacterium]
MKKIEEEWKTIEEFPDYEISNFGRCRNKKKNNLLKKCRNMTRGVAYYHYSLRNGSEKSNEARHKTHRAAGILVAKAFIENPNNYRLIEYVDGDTSNAMFTNLRWVPNIHLKRGGKVRRIIMSRDEQLKKLRENMEREERLVEALLNGTLQIFIYSGEIRELCLKIANAKCMNKSRYFKEEFADYATEVLYDRIDRGSPIVYFEPLIKKELFSYLNKSKQLNTVEIDERRI